MKTGKILKILFGIALILTICFITNHVQAAVTVTDNTHNNTIINGLNNSGGIILDYSTSKGNWYILCREKSVAFGKNSHTYIKDTRGINTVCDYPFTTNTDGKTYGGAWAYLICKNYRSGSTMQSLFWEAINGDKLAYRYYNRGLFANDITSNKNVSAAIREAQVYENTIRNGKLDSDHYTNAKITKPSKIEDLKDSGKAYYRDTYGPFKINCNSWIYNGIKAGITEISVTAKDNAGNTITPPYIFLTASELNNKDKYYSNDVKRYHGGDIVFIYNNQNILENTRKKDNTELEAFNKNMKNGFYIHFGQEVKEFTINFKVAYQDPNVKIYPIYTTDKISGTVRCMDHQDFNFSSLYTVGGTKYQSRERGSVWTTANPPPDAQFPSGVYRDYDSTYNATGYKHGTHRVTRSGVSYQGGSGATYTRYYCPDCGQELTSSNKVYQYGYYDYSDPWYCPNNSNCGTRQDNIPIQDLIAFTPNDNSSTKELSVKATVESKIQEPKDKAIEINLKKYDLSSLNKDALDNYKKLTQKSGAKFTISASQSGQNIKYEENVGTNTKITIKANVNGKNTKPVYVNIVETTAPTGFNTIQKNINLVLEPKFDENGYFKSFDPKFQPPWNGGSDANVRWENSKFGQSSFGGWKVEYTNFDTKQEQKGGQKWDFPNLYKSSANDYMIVDSAINEPYTIAVFDEAKPKNIVLNLQKYNVNNLGKTLNNSFKIEDFQFKVTAKQSGTTLLDSTFNYNTSSGINIIPINNDKTAIDVEIEETGVPDGYIGLNKKIKIKYNYNASKNCFLPTFTNSDWSAEGHYSNVYVSTSDDLFMAVNSNETSTVTVYNTPKTFKIKLIKYKSYFNDNNNSASNELSGAEFTVKAFQMNGNTKEDITISTSRGTTTSNGYTNGIKAKTKDVLEFTPKYVNSNNDIYIVIKETTVPKGYDGLSEPINMFCEYDNAGNWSRAIRITANSYKTNLGSDYALWTWYKTDDDDLVLETDGNGNVTGHSYSSAFPNTYCYIPNNSQSVTEIYSSHLGDYPGVKDFIRILKQNSASHTIEIYNEHLETGLEVKLEKYSYTKSIVDGDEVYTSEKVSKNDFKFDILVKQGSEVLASEEMKNLEFSIDGITNTETPIYVIISETSTPKGYNSMTKPINIKYVYNSTTDKWVPNYKPTDLNSVGLSQYNGGWQEADDERLFEYDYESSAHDYIRVDNTGKIIVYNYKRPVINAIYITKVDPENQVISTFKGGKFDIEFSNVESISFEGTKREADNNGKIQLIDCSLGYLCFNDIVILNENNPARVTITETKAPTGFNPTETVVVDIPAFGEPTLVVPNNLVNVTQKSVGMYSIVIQNEYIPISLSGNVWLDKTTIINNKTKGLPDGIKNGDDGPLEGVTVRLYNGEDEFIRAVTTDSEGNYEFNNIVSNAKGYYVEFEYNGMEYETDKKLVEPKATEALEEREALNNRFYRIYDTYAVDKDDATYTTNLGYTYGASKGVATATLNTTQGSQLKNEFKMHAKTEIVDETTTDLDLALTQREEADLAVELSLMNKNNIKVRNYVNTFFENDSVKNISNIISVDNETFAICKLDMINQGQSGMYVLGLTFNCSTNSSAWLDVGRTMSINDELRIVNNNDITYFGSISSTVQIQWNGEPLYLPRQSSKAVYLVINIPTSAFDGNATVSFRAAVDLIGYISPNGIVDKDSRPCNLDLDPVNYEGRLEDDSAIIDTTLSLN